MNLPELRTEDLQSMIDRARPPDGRERPRRVAVRGTTTAKRVAASDGAYEVVVVRSPIELRRALLLDRREAAKDGRVFVLAWEALERTLPHDLKHQFAGECVLTQVAFDRLQAQLRAPITEEVQNHPIANYLGNLPSGSLRPYVLGRAIDLDAAFRIYLEARFGLPALEKTDAAVFLLWSLGAGDVIEAVREVKNWRATPKQDFEDFLRRELDRDLFPALFEAIGRGVGSELVVGGLVVHTVLDPDADAQTAAVREHVLAGEARRLGLEGKGRLAALGRAAAAAVRDLLAPPRSAEGWRTTALRHQRPGLLAGVDARELLQQADDRLGQVPAEVLAGSALLPRGLVERGRLLGAAASAIASTSEPTLDDLLRVLAARDRVLEHVLVRDEVRLAASHVARLATYLFSRHAEALDASGPSRFDELRPGSASVPGLAAWMIRHGGWIDRALRELAELHVPELRPAVIQLTSVLRQERDAQNAVFGRALGTLLAAGRLEHPLVDRIQDVGARWIAPFMGNSGPPRPLLVLLLDGLSWGIATELLESLAERGWGTLLDVPGWQGDPRADGPHPKPVLAALPSVTSVSRAAFFGGALPERVQGLPSTQQDPARFATHPALKAYKPKLFLKADLGDGSDLAPEVRDAIADVRRTPLVGVVVNGVDDWLSGARQIVNGFQVRNVQPLAALLDACESAGRAILLASDHGHTLDRGPSSLAPSEHGRWRVGGAAANETAGELKFCGPDVWTPAGRDHVILPTVGGAAYVSGKRGYHGGATLEEVVCPTLFLDTNGAPLEPPRWWTCDPGAERLATPARRPGRGRKADAFPLFEPAPAVTGGPRLSERLARSALWKEMEPVIPSRVDRVQVFALIDALDRTPSLSVTEVSRVTGVRGANVAGFVSSVARGLNVDEEIIRFDHASKRVELDRRLLDQVFELGGTSGA